MKQDQYLSQLSGARFDKKIWMVAALISIVINAGLTAGLLIKKNTVQTILVPPEISKPFSMTDGNFNNAYIEQVSSWFVTLMLNYTPASFKYQMITFSKYIDPSLYAEIQKNLRQQLDDIQKQNRTSTFFIQKIHTRGLSAIIEGLREIKIGDTVATHELEYWYVKFNKHPDGQIALLKFKQVKKSDLAQFLGGQAL